MSVGKCSTVETLDGRIAFNSTDGSWIKGTLPKLGVLVYFTRLIESHLPEREAGGDGLKEYNVIVSRFCT